jgi:hypothetical protein
MEKENSAVEKVETISKSKGEKETNKPTEKQQADKRVKVAKAKKEKQKAKEKAPYGIYCIQYRGEVIYIGMTLTSFEQRWKEHL